MTLQKIPLSHITLFRQKTMKTLSELLQFATVQILSNYTIQQQQNSKQMNEKLLSVLLYKNKNK